MYKPHPTIGAQKVEKVDLTHELIRYKAQYNFIPLGRRKKNYDQTQGWLFFPGN